jgi:hypothetical protein
MTPADGCVVLVLNAPCSPGVLRHDDRAMVPSRPVRCSYVPDSGAALRPGWRYHDPVSGLEVRCLVGGNGCLTYRGRALFAVSCR